MYNVSVFSVQNAINLLLSFALIMAILIRGSK